MIWALSFRQGICASVRDFSFRMNISNTNEIFSRYSSHALTTITPCILWSWVQIKFKMTDLMPFLYAQIDKMFENFVRPDEYLQHQ